MPPPRVPLDHSVHVRIVGGEMTYDETDLRLSHRISHKTGRCCVTRAILFGLWPTAECESAEKRRRFSMANCESRGLRLPASTATE